MYPAESICEAILKSDFNFGQLQAIRRTIDLCIARLDAANAVALTVGNRVRLTRCRPKYLIGLTGTVVEYSGDKFVVKLDRGSVGKYSDRIRCESSQLEIFDVGAVPYNGKII